MSTNKLSETNIKCNPNVCDQIVTTSTISQEATTITPKEYTDNVYYRIKKNDIDYIREEYNNSTGVKITIFLEILLGVSTTILGVIISSIFAQYNPDSFAFWFCYLLLPILFVVFVASYIILQFIGKTKKDSFKSIVHEKILRITEEDNSEEEEHE